MAKTKPFWVTCVWPGAMHCLKAKQYHTNPAAQMRHALIRYLAPYCYEARTSSSVSESSTVTGDSSPLGLAWFQEALPAPPLLRRPVVVASAVSREAADDDTGGSGCGISSNERLAGKKTSHDPRVAPGRS